MDFDERSLPEITVKAVILGVVLSVVLGAANAYLGLFAGMTVSASIPAAVVSMGVLRLFRRSNILENNIVQTSASAGESLAAGVIFTMPALVILNYWEGFDFWWVATIAGLGGVLGVLFSIPLRRSLIIEERLTFPEGVATAEVLKAGHGDASEIKHIAWAAVAAGLLKLGGAGLRIYQGVFEAARGVGPTVIYFGCNLSPALLGVGYIVGLNIAVLVFLGGLCNWLIAVPILAAFENLRGVEGEGLPALEQALQIWSAKTRYIGVGAMVVGGLWTILNMRRSIFSGVRSGLRAYRDAKRGGGDIVREERDVPMKWILVLIAGSAVPLFVLYQVFAGRLIVSVPMAVAMLVMGFVFSAVAGYMGGLVGSSNNPISGVTIATVLFCSLLLLFLIGSETEGGPAAAILIGSVVCCAASIAGDNLQDLKAGHIVGATPWRQQVMQMVGTVSAALLMAPVLTLLLRAYGFAGHTSATGSALAAPQANLVASVAKGVFEGGLPWNFVFVGMGVAAGVIALDKYLERKGSGFRAPVLAVAIGFYLPFQLAVPIFAGGVIRALAKLYHKRKRLAEESERSAKVGVLFASGLVTGEAVIGILLAIPIVFSGREDVLAVLEKPAGGWLGAVLLAGVGYRLYRLASGKTWR